MTRTFIVGRLSPFRRLPKAELKALTVYMLSLREMPSTLLASPAKQ